MQAFRQFFKEKTDNKNFCALYEQECNVCVCTVSIFEKIEAMEISLDRLATELNVGLNTLIELKEADQCDPMLVIALCHHLSLKPPHACPKLS